MWHCGPHTASETAIACESGVAGVEGGTHLARVAWRPEHGGAEVGKSRAAGVACGGAHAGLRSSRGGGAGAEMSTTSQSKQLLLAGALGGPLTIGLYTPLRNAITLGAKDAATSAWSLYRLAFAQGLAGGWTGWRAPTAFSCPQFLAIGPLYHLYSSVAGPSLAIIPTALTESTISYGSQARNAQMAYNVTVDASKRVALQRPWDPRGAGLPAHIMRNACAMSGIRVLTHPVELALTSSAATLHAPLDARSAATVADFVSSIIAAAISMPFNQLFNFLAITPAAARQEGILASCAAFLESQYLTRSPSGKAQLSRTLLRDMFMRCFYIAPQLSTYSAIERLCVSRCQ